MCSEVRWKLCWENELELADHVELAEFFRAERLIRAAR